MTKILLVEDDKSLREIYGVRLLAEGFDIVSAGDGEEALAMAIKEKPTLIISDVMMPKISGFDMLDILRSTTETRDIKVIMMTALSSEDQRARGEQLGADRYLVKSQVGIEDVVRTVHEVLGDSPNAAAPAAATAAAVTSAPAEPVTDAAAPAVVPTEEPTLGASSPGNDSAGPLPPQPSESVAPAPVIEPVVSTPVEPTTDLESSLPQPTAPFSSPRPTNLGEQVVHPDTPAEPVVEPAIEPVPANDEPAPVDTSIAKPGELVLEPLSAPTTAPEITAAPVVDSVAPAENTPAEPTTPPATTPPAI